MSDEWNWNEEQNEASSSPRYSHYMVQAEPAEQDLPSAEQPYPKKQERETGTSGRNSGKQNVRGVISMAVLFGLVAGVGR